MQKRCKVWKEAVGESKLTSVKSNQVSETKVTVNASHSLPTVEVTIELAYTIYGSGQVDVDYTFKAAKKDLPEIPRIGMVLQLPKDVDNLSYYGRGPWENYIDRNRSAFVGKYQSKVADQYYPYSRPQENGHKSDVRWLKLTNQSGVGFKINANGETIGFNALHQPTSAFDPGEEKLFRTPLDVKSGDFVELHIDHKMMGVGGDNSWGAKPHSQYMLFPDKEYTYSFSIIPVK
jgi:beta-galactosidase